MSTTVPAPQSTRHVPVTLVDCDIHLTPRSHDELLEHLDPRFADRFDTDRRTLTTREVFLPFGNPARLDAYGDDGLPAGSDPALVERQLFGDERADFGVIAALVGQASEPRLNTAVAGAMNAWQAATWLARDDVRLFGSINVAIDDVAGAVREVERWAGHPGFKQVLIAHDADRPLGHPQYDPLWEAASRHGLPVGMHFNESHRAALGATPVGAFRSYVTYHALTHPLEYAAHVASWICAGTFSRFPGLRVTLLEGGFLWHRPVIARLMHQWEAKRTVLPDARKTPVECVRDHVRFASQPIEEADVARDVTDLMLAADAEHLLVFSSDYPHYDYDNPTRALPPGLPEPVRARILAGNAREWFDLPATRPAGPYDAEAPA